MERASTEKHLIDLERKRFLVPEDLTLIHLQSIIRKRLKLDPSKALFFLINGKSIVSLSKQVKDIYDEYKNESNFLHIFYASEDCFGGHQLDDNDDCCCCLLITAPNSIPIHNNYKREGGRNASYH